MGRRLVYNGGLGAFIGGEFMHARVLWLTIVCVLTLTSIFVPRWISWNSTSVCPRSSGFELTDPAFGRKDSLHLWPASSLLVFGWRRVLILSPD